MRSPLPWAEVRDLVESVLDLPPTARPEYLDSACPDRSVRRYVDSLILSYDRAGFLDHPPVHIEDDLAGRAIGPYRIIQEIGRGGMGAVYRATRADDQFSKQVALKLVHASFDRSLSIARFRTERQVLAGLEHPNIARLLDGGATGDGLPYFVMELVGGIPIDRYCESQQIGLDDRLKLFRDLCSAVHYAHQNLIVHRDIKPANILVTPEGVVKLLDFGIAKILEPDTFPQAIEPTGTLMRIFTPEFASPEQLRGGSIATTSDVYALGVVLYILLTGNRPYDLETCMPHEVAAAVCETEPLKPSRSVRPGKLRRELAGDLDTIILKALRKEPLRRYSSADQFSEDIRRHLQGLPVTARPDTWSYRTAKFVVRHRIPAAAALLLFLGLGAGVAITLYEAQAARVQQARAERRFNDVRQLANSLIFEIHDSIQNLPGATPARKLLVDRALHYLDSLAHEAGSDWSLQRELAWAYQRVGRVQGDSFSENLGDTAGALVSFRKALAIWEAVAAANPANVDDQLNLAYGHRLTANFTNSPDEIRQALAITRGAALAEPHNARVPRERARELESLATMQDAFGDFASSLESLTNLLRIQEARRAASPASRDILIDVAVANGRVGEALFQVGRRAEARKYNETSRRMFEGLSKDPNDALSRDRLAVMQVRYAEILGADGDLAGAVRSLSEALAIFESLSAADPANVLVTGGAADASARLGRFLVFTGKSTQGLSKIKRTIQKFGSGSDAANPACYRIWLGEALALTGNTRQALETFEQALADLNESSRSTPINALTNAAAVHRALADVLLRTGDHARTSTELQKAITLAERLAGQGNEQARYTLADAYSGLAAISARERNIVQAKDRLQRSLNFWSQVKEPARMTPNGFLCGSSEAVRKSFASIGIH